MDVFTFVIAIVAISCASGIVNSYLKNQRELRKQQVPDEDAQLEMDALRERIEILERIVTDGKYHLAKELDELERQG